MGKMKNFAEVQEEFDYIEAIGTIEESMWWTTKDGQNIRIDKMDTDHLKNTIRHIEQTGRLNGVFKKRFGPIHRNMKEEYYRRVSPAGEVLFGRSKNTV